MSSQTADATVSGVHLWLVLWKAYDAVARKSRESIASLGLGLSDFAVLEILLHKGPLPVNIIGGRVLLTSGSITTAIDRLEARKLVQRCSDPGDRRARVVHLTDEGRQLIESAFAQHAATMEELARDLAPEERLALLNLLKRFGGAAAPKESPVSAE